ncbi:hypothetical protein V8E55_011645 [Tylopilus felleus]
MVRFIKYGKLAPRNGDTSISTDLEWIPQVIQKVSHQVFYLDYRSLLAQIKWACIDLSAYSHPRMPNTSQVLRYHDARHTGTTDHLTVLHIRTAQRIHARKIIGREPPPTPASSDWPPYVAVVSWVQECYARMISQAGTSLGRWTLA